MPTPPIAVRRAERSEAAFIADFVNRAYEVEVALFGEGTRRTDLAEITASFEEPGTFFLIGESGGVVVASVKVQEQSDGLYFSMLSVDPAVQGRGIGAFMVREIESESRSRGLAFVRLNCIKERGLPAYYSRLGYAATHEQPDVLAGVDFHFVFMERRVAP